MSTVEDTTNEDKKNIEVEEREKMLNEENKIQQEKQATEDGGGGGGGGAGEQKTATIEENGKLNKTDTKEGRETKPKKIPIGGIQMPGFFTRSKSKEKCSESGGPETEGTELLETGDKDGRSAEEKQTQPTRIKLPNPFRKSKTVADDGEEKPSDQTQRKSILDTIRLPLVSVFPRKQKKDMEANLENQQAGLASMETLGDNDKSADNKNEDDLKNVPLDEKKDIEKQESLEEPRWKTKLREHRIVISALLVFILLLIIIIACSVPGRRQYSQPIKDGKYVDAVTSCGLVEGILDDGAVAFRGVPYARPPVGDLRFKPAKPLDDIKHCWNGTFRAHDPAPTCLQIFANGTTDGTEDCLTVDVITPYVRYENPLPVVVLIGSESLIGGSPGKMRPSTRFARHRDVLFVRPNFRVGALGFLATNQLSTSTYPQSSGNYGLSDIVQALKWIQLNIVHFGGDPNTVILFGHRAGATLVTALSAMKNANKLFARAWASSGGALYPGKPLSESEHEMESYLERVNCNDAQCLRSTDALQLTEAVPDVWRKPQPDLPHREEEPLKRHEWLVLDGQMLLENPAQVWTSEEGLPVKLVLGTTAHAASSDKLLMRHKTWTPELVRAHVRESKLNLTEEALRLYPMNYQGLSAMISDIRIVCPLLAISAQQKNTPFYVVTTTRGENEIADVDSDIDAILGRYEPKTPEQRRYVSAMQQLFYHYVWHGEVTQIEGLAKKILIVEQDVLPAANYSHCDYWITQNIVPRYAQLD